MTEIDDEYAKLSLLAGVFAASADFNLGRPYFIQIIRQQAWTLTWEKLAKWKSQAIQMGVPPEDLELSPDFFAVVPELLECGKKLQDKVDKKLQEKVDRKLKDQADRKKSRGN